MVKGDRLPPRVMAMLMAPVKIALVCGNCNMEYQSKGQRQILAGSGQAMYISECPQCKDVQEHIEMFPRIEMISSEDPRVKKMAGTSPPPVDLLSIGKSANEE